MIQNRAFICGVSGWVSKSRNIILSSRRVANNNIMKSTTSYISSKTNNHGMMFLFGNNSRGGHLDPPRGGSAIRLQQASTSTTVTSRNSNSSEGEVDNEKKEVEAAAAAEIAKESKAKQTKIAQNSMNIIGNSIKKSSFYGVPYLDTNTMNEFRVLFVLGGPGAGKGTQSDLLIQNYPCIHLSAGELLREETKKPNSPNGKLIEQCLVAGKIVPVEISLSLLQNAMQEQAAKHGKSIIFLIDGFPRNYDNLDGWVRCMSPTSNDDNNDNNNDNDDSSTTTNGASVWGVLEYQCPLSVLEQRILLRAEKGSGRSDDNIQSARKRFKTFETETVPVVDTLRIVQELQNEQNQPCLQVIDIHADQSLEQVWVDTQNAMNNFILNDVLTRQKQLFHAIQTNNVQLYQQLCAKEWFQPTDEEVEQKGADSDNHHQSPQEVMESQEGTSTNYDFENISNVHVEFISGTKVGVHYDRIMMTDNDNNDGGSSSSSPILIRETRLWSYRGIHGWQNIHFSRTPAVDEQSEEQP